MVTFLNNTIRKFNKLVIKYFIETYRLKIVNNGISCSHTTRGSDRNTLPKIVGDGRGSIEDDRYIYIYQNSFLVNNKILNLQYDSNLDESKYSLVYILYKNINYKDNQCYLDAKIKKKISEQFNKIRRQNNNKLLLNDNIIIIGRKYLHKNKIDKVYNSLGTFCIHKVKNESPIKIKVPTPVILEQEVTQKSIYRRNFLYNLKLEFENESVLCINKILKNSLFLDVEYINDIYDDFKTFPISKDSTLLFMIGFAYINKINNDLNYVNYTVNKLNKIEEYDILNRFLNDIIDKYNIINASNAINSTNKNNKPVIIFHWSNADKIIIEKSLKRHPDLYKKYTDSVKIKYIDLLLIVKKTMYFESYSLKFVVKQLLNISYDTDCKNGFDAMCSIIQNNCRLEKLNKTLNKTLNDFSSTQDIIKYNKIDTELLYILMKKIIS